ncbi:MAG: CopG family transcriptional regulator [Bacteroidetes bacterium SW_9_63_38]|nr:MAG: CopG family transcriptional regulator [Bacteroidetes bacterium SW_9_63_38]
MSGFPSFGAHAKAFAFGIVLALIGLGGYVYWGTGVSTDLPPVTVYKSPTCGCCADWVTHLRENGFSVTVKPRANVAPMKQQLGVPKNLAACHTAVVNDYVVEGHVPASEIRRMLANKPEFRGLSVPGMPVGSPGMERGGRVEPYSVLGFTTAGKTTVVAQHGPSN